MRIGNILVQAIDASDGQVLVIINESTGNEISFSRDVGFEIFHALGSILMPDEPDPF